MTQQEGYFIVDGFRINIYKLADGTLGISQLQFCKYLTGTRSMMIYRHNLKSASLGAYLPKEMTRAKDLQIQTGQEQIRIFCPKDIRLLCQAILHAARDGKLNRKWTSAVIKVEMLLLYSAEKGITLSLEESFAANPAQSANSFRQHLSNILRFSHFP